MVMDMQLIYIDMRVGGRKINTLYIHTRYKRAGRGGGNKNILYRESATHEKKKTVGYYFNFTFLTDIVKLR